MATAGSSAANDKADAVDENVVDFFWCGKKAKVRDQPKGRVNTTKSATQTENVLVRPKRQVDTTKSTTKTEIVYNFNYSCNSRGCMMYIVNKKFVGKKNLTRVGADVELKNMKAIQERFNLILINEKLTDVTSSELRFFLKYPGQLDHSQCGCFMFMISTHGAPLGNEAQNGKEYGLLCSDGEVISIKEIITALNDVNCPTLKSKPKLFFIHACRGTKSDDGIKVHVIGNKNGNMHDKMDPTRSNEHDLHDEAPSVRTNSPKLKAPHELTSLKPVADDYEAPYLQCEKDMLVMYAAPPGMFAWRSSVKGSWMIHELHKALMNYDFKTPTNFLKVLTKVTAAMARRTTCSEMGGKVIVPITVNRLTKDIIFKEL